MIAYFLRIPDKTLRLLQEEPEHVEEILYSEEERDELDIDKAWHGLHFLLTGDSWGGEGPLAKCILGGTRIGDDEGEGSVRYLTPEEVKEVAMALDKLMVEELAARFNPESFAAHEIYPLDKWEKDDLEYLLSYYKPLSAYYQQAAANGEAMLQYIL